MLRPAHIENLSNFVVLVFTVTKAENWPYSIEPKKFRLFQSEYFQHAVPLIGSNPNLCSECLVNLKVSEKNCTNSIVVHGQNPLYRNSKVGFCFFLDDKK